MRLYKGLTQADLADKLKVTQSYVAYAEKGNLSFDKLIQFAEKMNLSVDIHIKEK